MTNFRRIYPGLVRVLVSFVVLALLTSHHAIAQDHDPLSLTGENSGYDAARSRVILGKDFAGVWQVVHTADDGPAWRGRAEVSGNGGGISLVLFSPDGPQYYESVEVDAMRFQPGSDPFVGGLTARFRKVAEPVLGDDGQAIGTATPLPLPTNQCMLSMEKDERNLDLFIKWSNAKQSNIRVQLSAAADANGYKGIWHEEADGRLRNGGLATWIRGEPRIDGILVVGDQFDPSAGMNYPYTPDGTKIAHVSDLRTLVVYGRNLPEMADRAALSSLSGHVSYEPDFRTGDDRMRVITGALAGAGGPDPDQVDALIVLARLQVGVGPGAKALSINGAQGWWPLAFANQIARLQFVRTAGVATDTFFEGDSGFVEVVYDNDVRAGDISVKLMLGDNNPIEAGVLMARRVDDEDPFQITYRTEPIHFYSNDDASMTPPPDEDALRVPVLEGGILQAVPLDRVQALTVPQVARADVRAHPGQLGALWTQTLNRVAACHGDAIDDYETYQHEESENISNVIITELDSRNISFLKGDHAAALLIRDEFVKQTLALLPEFDRQARNLDLAREARASARQNLQIQRQPFWRDTKVTFVKERRFLWDIETEYSLAETLDIAAIAVEQGVAQDEVRAWAEEQTIAAAIAHVEKMEKATSTVLDIDDCDVESLLQIAGYRADPLISRILPRLVKLERYQGPPAGQHWVADTVAQGFVRSLHIAGAAIRAQESYSEADTAVAAAVTAILTAGASIGLEAGGYVAASIWVSLGDAALGMATGLMGVHDYYAGEEFHEFAQAAAPVMGDDILNNAIADRRSAVMAAVGVILPTVSGASNLSQLRQLRHFKTIQRGQRLFQATDGVLDDLSHLSDAQRTDLSAYYLDMLRRADRAGIDKLDGADRAAFAEFQKYFGQEGVPVPEPGNLAAAPDVVPASAPDTPDVRPMAPETVAPPPDAVDPNATVAVRPTTDPTEMATEISPNAWQEQPELFCDPEPPGPRPGDAVNLYERDPGGWLDERGVTEADILEYAQRVRNGGELTPEEILDNIDYMRLLRQQEAE